MNNSGGREHTLNSNMGKIQMDNNFDDETVIQLGGSKVRHREEY